MLCSCGSDIMKTAFYFPLRLHHLLSAFTVLTTTTTTSFVMPQPLYSSHSYPQQTPQTHSIHQLTHLHHDPSFNQYFVAKVQSLQVAHGPFLGQTLSLQHFSQKPLLPQQTLPQPIPPQKVQLQHQEPLHISFPSLIKKLEKTATQSKTDHSAATSLAPPPPSPPPHPLHPVASALPFSVHPLLLISLLLLISILPVIFQQPLNHLL